MAAEVYMDIPQVQKMSKTFDTFGDTLDAVSKVLRTISMLLKAAAFVSLGSTAAASAFIDRIQPRIQKLAEQMKELSVDLTGAVKAYSDGDMSGSQRFV